MNRTLAYLMSALFVAVAGCGGADPAVDSAAQGLILKPPIQWHPLRLYVDHIDPAVPIEGQPMHVLFEFVNDTNNVKTGWVGARISPTNAAPYDNDMSTDWAVSRLPAHSTMRGEVTIPAPATAGPHQSLEVYYYETRPLVAEFVQKGPHIADSTPFDWDLGARYYVDITKLHAVHTREPDLPGQNDQDVITCGGSLAGGNEVKCTSTDATTMYPTPGLKDLGIVHKDKPINVEMGPFVTVPGTGPALTVSYSGLDHGNITGPLDTILNGISSITSGVLQGLYPSFAAAIKAGDAATHSLNDWLTADCNGLVFDDTITWSSTELQSMTLNGSSTLVRQSGTDPLPPGSPYISPDRCGAHPIYDITLAVRRAPWNSGDRLVVTPDQRRLRANGSVALTSNDANPGAVIWQVEGGAQTGYFTLNDTGATFTLTKSDVVMGDLFEVTAFGTDGDMAHAYIGGPLTPIIRFPPILRAR